jgi:DNA-binding SARP family transcriptional activator
MHVRGLAVYQDQVDRPVHHGEQDDALTLHLIGGGPYLTVGRQRREVPAGSKQLLVLVALRRRRVERHWAAGTLWPFVNEGRAAGNLRSALWRLRRAGIDVLVADKWSLALSTDVLVDLHLMDERATRLIEGKAEDGDLAISPYWADALDFLPGWYDDWALMERERVRQRSLHALDALSEKLASLGHFADAVEAAILAVSAEPLRESAQRALILAHIAEGNLAEAHHCYRSYRDLLRRELGMAPSSDLLNVLRGPAARRPLAHSGVLLNQSTQAVR